jgi:hypothetical protein
MDPVPVHRSTLTKNEYYRERCDGMMSKKVIRLNV